MCICVYIYIYREREIWLVALMSLADWTIQSPLPKQSHVSESPDI